MLLLFQTPLLTAEVIMRVVKPTEGQKLGKLREGLPIKRGLLKKQRRTQLPRNRPKSELLLKKLLADRKNFKNNARLWQDRQKRKKTRHPHPCWRLQDLQRRSCLTLCFQSLKLQNWILHNLKLQNLTLQSSRPQNLIPPSLSLLSSIPQNSMFQNSIHLSLRLLSSMLQNSIPLSSRLQNLIPLSLRLQSLILQSSMPLNLMFQSLTPHLMVISLAYLNSILLKRAHAVQEEEALQVLMILSHRK
mmetsp:Transcript_17740/g.19780  ORF Transcript_17740/g.19780 Transcript_17740/m.19780 type:complete len:246 (+) Transcript_17740:349-1086(+)